MRKVSTLSLLLLLHSLQAESNLTLPEAHRGVLVFSDSSDLNQTRDADSNATAVRGQVDHLLSLAKSKLGDTYQLAKAGPDRFDCSGLVYYVFTKNGIVIPRTSLMQSQSGKKIKREDLRKGDMVFFDTYARGHVNHSGIYLGDGKFIHASSGKAHSVTISDLDHGFYKEKFRWGVRKME